jgi:hypothetical protein
MIFILRLRKAGRILTDALRFISLQFIALQVIGIGVLLAMLAAPVQAQEGAGILDAKEKLKAKGCGSEVLETTLDFQLFSNFTWVATDDDLFEYRGGWSWCCAKHAIQKGRIELSFNASWVTNEWIPALNTRIATLCGEPEEVTFTIRKKFKGKIKNGKAKIKAKYDLTDNSPELEESVRRGRWKLRAKGSFTEVTP